MKPGGGARKGSSFERRCARDLSRWWFGSDNECYLWRRPGSGRIKSLGPTRHTGDIVPAVDSKPLPYPWPFHFELKSVKDLNLIRLITEPEKSFIKKVWDKAEAERRADLDVILLVKQNFQPELVFMATETYTKLGLDIEDSQIFFLCKDGAVVGLAWAKVLAYGSMAKEYFNSDRVEPAAG